jgi:hypothetical protein
VVAVVQPHREEAEVPVVAEMMLGQVAPELQGKAIREVLESIQMVAVVEVAEVLAHLGLLAQVADLWLAHLVVLD